MISRIRSLSRHVARAAVGSRFPLALAVGLALACLGDNRAAAANKPSGSLRSSSAATPLFPVDGTVAGWLVRSWNDVSLPAAPNALWNVAGGVLQGSLPRGTWLVSEREYGDFILEFDFRLGERGQSGVGLRFPVAGDPAVEGLEVQMVDPRFYGTNYTGQPWEFTGALYKVVAPTADAFKPTEWNHYLIQCKGPLVSVTLNGKKVVDVDLSKHTETPERGKPLADRPRRGRIGFQEISRGGGQVEIRNATIRVLDGPA